MYNASYVHLTCVVIFNAHCELVWWIFFIIHFTGKLAIPLAPPTHTITSPIDSTSRIQLSPLSFIFRVNLLVQDTVILHY